MTILINIGNRKEGVSFAGILAGGITYTSDKRGIFHNERSGNKTPQCRHTLQQTIEQYEQINYKRVTVWEVTLNASRSNWSYWYYRGLRLYYFTLLLI